jgi:alkylhydroperoxidase/carboxymuconolactone decarboxylase family protein YurZ
MATDLEQELKRTTALRGFRFGLHDFVAAVKGVDALKKHNDATQANYLKPGLIDRKTKELAIIAACVSLKDSAAHLTCHMHAAQKAGVTPDEILELIELLGGWIGNVAKINGLEAWRATFRPDLPAIQRVVELE